MPYFIETTWFPINKASEVAKIYMEERKKYPRDRSLGKVLVEAVKADEEGMISMLVMDVKEGKLEEALKRQQKIDIMYHDIEGYRYKMEVWWTTVEALDMIGMKLPE